MSKNWNENTKKYSPPPPTIPLVQIADVDRAVISVIAVDSKTMKEPQTKDMSYIESCGNKTVLIL
jgi:hypothetical protein